ncbi:MAG: DUF1611 domain-containing protein [Candidatus Velthaea sp.]|jgi:uncharacterized NAD-dependent epimerase/dehydratase family protein
MERRYLILAPHVFATRAAKTAHGVIAYSTDVTVAVVDPSNTGRTVRDVLPHLDCDAPIVASVEAGLAFKPTSLLVGIAPAGGALPPEFRLEIAAALRAGLEIVSGLHTILSEDEEFAQLAKAHDSRIWDLRLPPAAPLFSGAAYDIEASIVLTVGSDCAVGKMTAALELARAAEERGRRAVFVPTGQTGIAIAGWGTSVDRVVADFAAGAAEQLVLEAERRADDTGTTTKGLGPLLVVEGQGAVNHPAYAPVTLSLLYGSAPDALVLVHIPSRSAIDGYDIPLLSYRELIRTYEMLCAGVKPAKVVGIALNTRDLGDVAARAAIADAAAQTGLPCDDVVRFGPFALYDAIAPHLGKTAVLHAD